MSKRIHWLTPSYTGIRLSTVKNVLETRDLLVERGYKFAFDGVEHKPLDLARNEIVGMFLRSRSDVALLADDDGTVEPQWIAKAIPLLETYPVLSFPQLCRPAWKTYNVMLADERVNERGTRLHRCLLTGLGAVLVTRAILEKMAASAPLYDSILVEEYATPNIFSSMTVAKERMPFGGSKGKTTHKIMSDDMIFSLLCPAPIYAVVDAVTTHDGHRGCLGEMIDIEKNSEVAPVESTTSGITKRLLQAAGE